MAKPAFTALKSNLDEACATLRKFTLGYRGFNQRQGESGIQLVVELCERMGTLYQSGPNAAKATAAVYSARGKVGAAQARLNLLRAK